MFLVFPIYEVIQVIELIQVIQVLNTNAVNSLSIKLFGNASVHCGYLIFMLAHLLSHKEHNFYSIQFANPVMHGLSGKRTPLAIIDLDCVDK